VATIRQYLQTGLVDELHLAIVPILLGGGERLFGDLDVNAAGYECVEHRSSARVFHVLLARASTA
jgi:dihydrofolate reductase